jgi:hypothetical protein
VKNPFNKEFKDFLTDRCDELDFSKSRNYRKFEGKAEELYAKIKQALSEDLHGYLLYLDDLYNGKQAAAANLAYQEGFVKGTKLILDILSNSADLSPELSDIDLKLYEKENLIIHQPGEDPNAPGTANLSKEGVRCVFIKIGSDIHCSAIGEPIAQEEAKLLYQKVKDHLIPDTPLVIRNPEKKG